MALKNLFLLWAAALFVVRSSAPTCANGFKCPSSYFPNAANAAETDLTTANCCTACADGQFGVGIGPMGGNTACAACHPECARCTSRSECQQCKTAAAGTNGQYVPINGRCDWTCDIGFRVAKTDLGVSTYVRGTASTHTCAACGGTHAIVSAGCAKCESTDNSDANDKCLVCASDHTMPPGCSTCTALGSQSCAGDCSDGYVKIAGVCNKCSDSSNCKTCGTTVATLNACATCSEGWVLDDTATLHVCKKCGTNIKTCLKTELNEGTGSDEHGCVPRADMANAAAWTSNKCELTCNDFYKKVGNKCVPCPIVEGAQCPKCDDRQCDAPGTGAQCSDGKRTPVNAVAVNAGNQGVCKKESGTLNCAGATKESECTAVHATQCTWVNDYNMATCSGDCIPNCHECHGLADAFSDGATECDDGKCNDGYVQNADRTACEKCKIGNCEKCALATKDTECTDCLIGYFGEGCDKRCSTMPNCLTCSRGGHFCRLCSDESAPRGVAHSCSHASMNGDPHVTNLRGEKFDVMQSGKHSLVCLPRGHCGKQNNLHVEVMVARLSGGSCESAFVQDLTLEGKWVGHAITISAGTLRKEKPFGLTSEKFYSFKDLQKEALTKHNEKTMTIVGLKTSRETIAVDFEGVKISVEHVSHPHLSFLNVNAQGLLKQDVEVGGLLGLDGHKEAATAPNGCKHKVRAHRGESDILASELIGN